MPETELMITPFVNCPFLYQAVAKLAEETGEVCSSFYRLDTKEPGTIESDDVLNLMIECGDVIQAAVNIIHRCGYDVQDIIDKVTEKNIARGYYDAK